MSWQLHWYGEAPDLRGGFAAWTHCERRVETRTVRVDLMRDPAGRDVVLKRYLFPEWQSALRAAAHTLPFTRPKARREAEALANLVQRGLPAATPLGWGVLRGPAGLVQDSWLLTLQLPGEDLERRLRGGAELPQGAWFAVGESADLLHAAGVQHRGLSARNVILDGPGPDQRWRAAWIDTAKTRFRPRLQPAQRAAELLRFWASVPQPVPDGARLAFAAGYGDPEASEPERLWTRIPLPLREELGRELERERGRLR